MNSHQLDPLDVGSIDSFEDDVDSCDKLLESMQQLRPLLSGSHSDMYRALQAMAGSSFSAPMGAMLVDSLPTNVAPDDFILLDSPSMLHSIEQDMLLSRLGGTASSNEEVSHHHLEQLADKWNWPDDAPSDFLQEVIDSSLVKDVGSSFHSKWCEETPGNQCEKLDKSSSAVNVVSQSRKGPIPILNWVSREASASDLPKQLESSDTSDFMDDDEDGSKQGMSDKASASKNLVSERRRRKKLNERLYSLRAIVPKISKMDKASIVGDAITYVQDLQKQVEVIQEDIQKLQSIKDSLASEVPEKNDDVKPVVNAKGSLPFKFQDHKVLEVVVFSMEKQTFHLRIHCKKGPGVLIQVARALEALDFEIVSANLTSVNEHVFNTIVVKVKNGKNVKAEDLQKTIMEIIPSFGLCL